MVHYRGVIDCRSIEDTIIEQFPVGDPKANDVIERRSPVCRRGRWRRLAVDSVSVWIMR